MIFRKRETNKKYIIQKHLIIIQMRIQNKTQKKTQKKHRFTLKQYNSKDGMMTSIWGPSMWHTMHTISFNYPVKPTYKDKINYKKFITNLKYILPCGKCRENFRKNLKQLPLKMDNMKSRYTFSKYVYNLHEVVNTMLNKKSNLSYDEVRERYEHFRARCPKKEYITKGLETIKAKVIPINSLPKDIRRVFKHMN